MLHFYWKSTTLYIFSLWLKQAKKINLLNQHPILLTERKLSLSSLVKEHVCIFCYDVSPDKSINSLNTTSLHIFEPIAWMSTLDQNNCLDGVSVFICAWMSPCTRANTEHHKTWNTFACLWIKVDSDENKYIVL